MRVMSCANCAWFLLSTSDAKQGNCRRNPPTPLVIGIKTNPVTRHQDVIIQSAYASVGATEWCGEWRAKPGLGDQLPDLAPAPERMQ